MRPAAAKTNGEWMEESWFVFFLSSPPATTITTTTTTTTTTRNEQRPGNSIKANSALKHQFILVMGLAFDAEAEIYAH